MIDLPPYPSPEACVIAQSPEASRVTGNFTFSGEVGVVVDKAREERRLRVVADTRSGGIRFVLLSGQGDVPYRVIGGILFEAQRRRVIVGFASSPPICFPDEQP